MSSDRFRLFGTHEGEPYRRTLTAGPLSVTLESGNLRTLRFLGHEVLRAVSFLVRDKDWGTCVPTVRDLAIDASQQDFSVRYLARFTAPDGANLDCDISITGSSNRLAFAAECISDADFETARAGFAVLHPVVGVAGQPVEVRHADGTTEKAHWPEMIEPWQPFKDIAAITHLIAPGIVATTDFEGDVFEMEDQRNWTDGSYKTYVRPLALPWPYKVKKGEPLNQQIVVTVTSELHAVPASVANHVISLALTPTQTKLPQIGVGLRPECLAQERVNLDALRHCGAAHLVAHLDPLVGHGLEALKGFAEISTASGLPVTLELAVPCRQSLDVEMAGIAALVKRSGLDLEALFVSPAVDRQSTPPGSIWPECPPLEDVYTAARKAFPGVRLGGGMMSYFTELNRKRVPAELIDYVSHCTNPIVHAADDLSVMQTFEALRYVTASVRALYGDKPYRIGPSTIAMRQNPYGSATKRNSNCERIPMADLDPRHNGQFGAAWVLAYAATTAPTGLEMLTLSTLAGPFGLIAGPDEPMPTDTLRPLAGVIARLGAMAGESHFAVESSRPEAVVGLATATRLLLANITPEPQSVALGSWAGGGTTLGIDAREIEPTNRVELDGYGCAEIVRIQN